MKKKPIEYKVVSVRLEMKHYRKLARQAKANDMALATYVRAKTFDLYKDLI